MYKGILSLLLIALVQQSAFSQIKRIEPMNWWVGMKDQNLQLLVYGENISELTPQIKYPGVVIKKINKADSKNYLFLDLLIAKNTKPGSFDIQFRKENELTCSQSFSLLPRSFKPREMKGFSAPDVIYLITPDRFVNGDKSNDIINDMLETTIDRKDGGGRHGGDIRGMINSLDYIAVSYTHLDVYKRQFLIFQG